MKELKGLTIENVYISDDKEWLVFKTPERYLAYYAYGDCCSNSWFESIINFKNLLNSKVIDAKHRELPLSDQWERIEDKEDNGNDVISYYCMSLETTGGIVDIEYRNASNGYYGGSCDYNSQTEIKELENGDIKICEDNSLGIEEVILHEYKSTESIIYI